MNLKNIRPALMIVCFAALSVATKLSAAIPSAENLLPADTFFVLTTPDCATLRKVTGQSPQLLLWNSAAMKPFHDKFMAKWSEQLLGPLEHDLGVSLASFADLPQGQLTLAVTRNGWDGLDEKKAPGWLLLMDARDQSGVLKTNLDLLKKKWAAAGKTMHTETIHGITFSIVPLSTNDLPPSLVGIIPGSQPVQELGKEPKIPAPGEMVFAQYQSLLIVGSSIKTVEPVASRLTGGSVPCLADNALFTADKASQFRDSPIYYAWFNAQTLFNLISQIPATEPDPLAPSLIPHPSPGAVLSSSGLMGLKSVSLSYHQSHEGSTISVFLSAPEATRQGLLKMFSTGQKDSNPPAFIPADAVKFWRWRLDGPKMWAELLKAASGISPSAVGTLNGFIDMANSLAQQKDASFDLRKNLIGNLGDDWMSYEKGPTGTSLPELSQSHGIFLFATANPEQSIAALKTVSTLVAQQESTPVPRDFLGHTIHTIALRPQMTATGATVQNLLYCSISSGYVAVTSDVSILEEYLRSAGTPPRPLSQTPGLADALQQIGGAGNGLFGYQDHQVVMRAAFSSLKQAAIAGAGGKQSVSYLPKSFNEWLDFSLLPDYNQVAKYFYFSVFNGTTSPDGITFKGFYPRPPQLN